MTEVPAGATPSFWAVNVAYPKRLSLPMFLTAPLITPHILCMFPSGSSTSSWRYMKPPHSAMQGMPPSIFSLMSESMDWLRSSSAAWSSGYPPERTMPSTSGRRSSFIGEKYTISAPHLCRISMLSSYVKQNVSSLANPMRTFPSMGLTSGTWKSRSGAVPASSIRRSMSMLPSRTSASWFSLSLRDSISSGRTSPRCLLSRTRWLTFGTYPSGMTPIASTSGFSIWKILSDI